MQQRKQDSQLIRTLSVQYNQNLSYARRLLRRANCTGLLYLENNLTTEAFTPDRLEVLHLLVLKQRLRSKMPVCTEVSKILTNS